MGNTISQQCIEEMTELASNSDLMAASNRLNSCPTSEAGNSATVDYNQCSTAVGAFQLACTSAGGKYSTSSFSIRCSYSGQSVTVSAIDAPECAGQSCDISMGDA